MSYNFHVNNILYFNWVYNLLNANFVNEITRKGRLINIFGKSLNLKCINKNFITKNCIKYII